MHGRAAAISNRTKELLEKGAEDVWTKPDENK